MYILFPTIMVTTVLRRTKFVASTETMLPTLESVICHSTLERSLYWCLFRRYATSPLHPTQLQLERLISRFCLRYFKIVMNTSDDAWMRHAIAAEWLFEMVRPEKCQEVQFHSLFHIIAQFAGMKCILLGLLALLLPYAKI